VKLRKGTPSGEAVDFFTRSGLTFPGLAMRDWEEPRKPDSGAKGLAACRIYDISSTLREYFCTLCTATIGSYQASSMLSNRGCTGWERG
jgi:hypothetical protein